MDSKDMVDDLDTDSEASDDSLPLYAFVIEYDGEDSLSDEDCEECDFTYRISSTILELCSKGTSSPPSKPLINTTTPVPSLDEPFMSPISRTSLIDAESNSENVSLLSAYPEDDQIPKKTVRVDPQKPCSFRNHSKADTNVSHNSSILHARNSYVNAISKSNSNLTSPPAIAVMSSALSPVSKNPTTNVADAFLQSQTKSAVQSTTRASFVQCTASPSSALPSFPQCKEISLSVQNKIGTSLKNNVYFAESRTMLSLPEKNVRGPNSSHGSETVGKINRDFNKNVNSEYANRVTSPPPHNPFNIKEYRNAVASLNLLNGIIPGHSEAIKSGTKQPTERSPVNDTNAVCERQIMPPNVECAESIPNKVVPHHNRFISSGDPLAMSKAVTSADEDTFCNLVHNIEISKKVCYVTKNPITTSTLKMSLDTHGFNADSYKTNQLELSDKSSPQQSPTDSIHCNRRRPHQHQTNLKREFPYGKRTLEPSRGRPVSSQPDLASPNSSLESVTDSAEKKESDRAKALRCPKERRRKCKPSQKSCIAIPTNGPIVDFTSFQWPRQITSDNDKSSEIDGRLKTSKHVKTEDYFKPVEITLSAFDPPYTGYFHSNSKDPRIRNASVKYHKMKLPDEGLFSRLMSLSQIYPSSVDGALDLSNKAFPKHCSMDGEKPTVSQLKSLNNVPMACDERIKPENLMNRQKLPYSNIGEANNEHMSTNCVKRKKSKEMCSKDKTQRRQELYDDSNEKKSEIGEIHQESKKTCLGLQTDSLLRDISAIKGNSNCEILERKQDLPVEHSQQNRPAHGGKSRIENGQQNEKSKRKHISRNCRKEHRNVLDYHLCSRCMLDKNVARLNPPIMKIKSTSCLNCAKHLNPKDLMCKSCKQCFPNMMTYAGHVYNLVSFFPSHKNSSKDHICSHCRQTFPTRFLFHRHLAQSNCTRACFFCDRIFPSRSCLKDHICEGDKGYYKSP